MPRRNVSLLRPIGDASSANRKFVPAAQIACQALRCSSFDFTDVDGSIVISLPILGISTPEMLYLHPDKMDL
jgi:hypothetical protein